MNIRYLNKTPEDFDCWLATRPVITPSEVEYDRYKIPGRVGELIGTYPTRGNANITFTLHQKITSSTTHSIDEIRAWLSTPFVWDYTELFPKPNLQRLFIISSDPNYCYEIIETNINSYMDKADDYKRIEVVLSVFPFKLRIDPEKKSNIPPLTSYTMTLVTDVCEPIISFNCSATQGTITLNDYEITVYATPNELMTGYVDIDVRRKITTYMTAGNSLVGADNLMSGDYDKMKLINGANVITTSAGVNVRILRTNEGFIV